MSKDMLAQQHTEAAQWLPAMGVLPVSSRFIQVRHVVFMRIWIFDRVWMLQHPIACKGQQRLWDVPQDVHTAIIAQVKNRLEQIAKEG